MKIHVQIIRFTCCLNMGFDAKMLKKLGPSCLHGVIQKVLRHRLTFFLYVFKKLYARL